MTIARLLLATMPAAIGGIVASPAAPRDAPAAPVAQPPDRARLFVLTDIGNEPDDQMSLVRLLLYSNAIDIEGLAAVTSTWLRSTTNAATLRAIIADYGAVRPQLLRHAAGWPTADALLDRVVTGLPRYGMDGVGEGRGSAASRAIIAAADRADARPLWISVWGGASALAQALYDVRRTRSPDATRAFVSRLRVYAIADQDDAGAWIRREFPALFVIVTPSSQDSGDYAAATWTGISGDAFYRNGAGADARTIGHDWLDRHIRGDRPLARRYLRHDYIMEGDTPAFLGLIPNGLNRQDQPDWGGWGGRYVLRRPAGETRAIWTQGGEDTLRLSSRDTVIGTDGRPHVSDQATIWRWRTAFQHDFAARMAWTHRPWAGANHAPLVAVDGDGGAAVVRRDARLGETLRLDARASRDPDGQRLRYRWYAYPEAGQPAGQRSAVVTLAGAERPVVAITPTTLCDTPWPTRAARCDRGTVHVVLEVTDDGAPSLTSYRRIILSVTR